METNNITFGDYSKSFNQVVYNAIKPNSTCLDVGCSTGNLGLRLIEFKNCIVDGIDINSIALKKAKEVGYKDTFKINLNSSLLDFTELNNKKYDCIIIADVLEHLMNPENILANIKQYLSPKGVVVISLPNVAFIINRILLLLGKWDYREYGTLDKTHLKFYTIKSGQKIVKSCGFNIINVTPYNQFGILKRLGPLTNVFPSLFAYQFLVIAKVASPPPRGGGSLQISAFGGLKGTDNLRQRTDQPLADNHPANRDGVSTAPARNANAFTAGGCGANL